MWEAAWLRVASHLIPGDVKNWGGFTRLSGAQEVTVCPDRVRLWGPGIALSERGRGLPTALTLAGLTQW